MMGHSGHSVLSNIGLFADKKYKWGDQGVFGGILKMIESI